MGTLSLIALVKMNDMDQVQSSSLYVLTLFYQVGIMDMSSYLILLPPLLSPSLPFLSLPFLLLSPPMGAEAMGWQDRYNPIIFTSDPPDRGLCTQASRQIALVRRGCLPGALRIMFTADQAPMITSVPPIRRTSV